MDVRDTAAPLSPPRPAPSGMTRPTFNIAAMQTSRVGPAIFNWLSNYPQREFLMAFFRRFWPFPRIPGLGIVMVLRDADVREVLAHDREFPVPWGARMMRVTGSKNFVLGMANGEEYRRNYQQIARAFAREDVAQHVVPLAARASEEMLRGKKRIDAVRDLIWAVPAQLCEDYYGIETPDKLLLADWTVAMSSYLFGTASEDTSTSGEALAMTAADGFRNLIRSAIESTRRGDRRGIVLPRLIDMQAADPDLTDDVLEAHLFGMVTGFIPTNLLAGGNMLETLLRREDFHSETRKAALRGDDDLLWRCLREALRFRHINMGPLRTCGPDGYTVAAGTRFSKRFAAGAKILASTQSAMFDSRRVVNPKNFDPNRAPAEYLVFGYGQHWCVGAYIAIAQITQTFKALLRKPGLRRAPGKAGRLQFITAYPAHLTVEFDE
jgi:cytochrome P450